MSHPRNIRKFIWTNLAILLTGLVAVQVMSQLVFVPVFGSPGGHIATIVTIALVVVGVSVPGAQRFYEPMARLQRQNRELLALHQASLEIEADADLTTVLGKVVEGACDVLSVEFGGLTYLDANGEIREFITHGMDDCDDDAPPGHGVIGAVTRDGGSLMLANVADHPESIGFPEGHPPMKPLLAVPLICNDGIVGHLYMSDTNSLSFTQEHMNTLERFAAVAAVAIDNARLQDQVRSMAITEERQRIAREMHDSLAQVLGYVNSKAQAAQIMIDSGKTEAASAQLTQMAEASRIAYADVREGILDLRTSVGAETSFVEVLETWLPTWEDQSGVKAGLTNDGVTDGILTSLAEVHLLRIIQEALSNVRKHAHATHAGVHLRCDGGFVVASIADNGRGIDVTEPDRYPRPRFGMSTMRERAESMGGTMSLESNAGAGTIVTVRLPIAYAQMSGENA